MTPELSGIIPPIVTPFHADESVDEAALKAEVDFHIDVGVHGLCVTGSTGDGQMLSLEDTVGVAQVALDQAAGRVPVIAGIIRDSTREIVEYGKALKEVGVPALQVTPVHYLFQPDEETTLDFYRTICDETGLPVIIYNVIPYALIPATTCARLLNELPGVIGIKQSGGNIHQLADLLYYNPPGGRIFTAVDDLLFPAYLMGARGSISATLTVAPKLCLEQWNAVQEGDNATALSIHNKLLPIWRAVEGPNMTVRIKAALAMMGRYGGYSRSPLTPVSDAERESIREALEQASLLAA